MWYHIYINFFSTSKGRFYDMRYRIETDSLGSMQVPAEAYYGIQTLRGKNNFSITKRGLNRQMIKGLAIVKKAAANANADCGLIDAARAKAISLSCDEILNGRLHGQFITDLIQGGAGTSMNMNANEVIANRANEMMGGEKGKYDFVHPLDHVNYGQSTNDVVPTAGKIATYRQTKKLVVELKKLIAGLETKATEFKGIYKMGRTHLQVALPMTLEQEFKGYASALNRHLERLEEAMQGLLEINLGATAIGTSLNANPKYIKKVVQYICKYTGEDYHQAKNLMDNTSNLDSFLWLSSAFKTLATQVSKIANDIRLMAGGPGAGFGELILPKVQPGSTLMPGKFNPVILEVVNQVAFYVIGLDTTITKAVEAGQFELNVYIPVILYSLFEQMNTLRRAIRTLREKAIDDLKVNPLLSKQIENATSLVVTPLIPHLGYDTTTRIVLEAQETNTSVKDIILREGLLNEEDLNEILDVHNMATPGIVKEELLIEKNKTKEKKS